jgi:hypothetical protein
MSSKAVNAIYNSVKERLPLNKEQFIEALKDWEFIELYDKNELFGAVMVKEHELHVGFTKTPTMSIRRYIKNTLGNVINKYGFATTSVTKGNEKGLNFCKRFGYQITSEDKDRIYMKCDRCNYV